MRQRTNILLIAGLLLGLLVVAPTATPFQVESATSDAVSPAIESGDAYVTVPADTISEGDIVVFWAPEKGTFLTREVLRIDGGRYVVGTGGNGSGTTDPGANATTGDPRVVPRSSVAATVPTLMGAPVVLPRLGGVFAALAAYRIVALFLLLFVLAALFVSRRLLARTQGQAVMIRVRTLAIPLLAVLFVACLAITPLSATAHQLTYTLDGTNESSAVAENTTRAVSLPATTPPLTKWVVRGEGTTVANWTEEEGGINATLSIPPPERTTRTVVTVRLFPYPEWTPTPLVETAHDVHPAVASLLGAVALVGPLALLYRVILDPNRLVARVRRRRLYVFGRG
jgi:hypothetical protein